MTKKTQDLFIAIGLLLIGYFFGDTVAKINKYSPVKIPETVEDVRNVDVFKKDDTTKNNYGQQDELSKAELEKLKIKNRDLKEGMVRYIIDGDTVILNNGEKIRYIGMDTPERGQCWYHGATDFNRKLVEGKKVRLEIDKSNRDRYQRLLRYVYAVDKNGREKFVNLELVKAGLARVKEYKPDVERYNELKEAEKVARERGLGLWGGCRD